MNKIEKLADKLYPIAKFVNTQRHFVAIRDSFIAVLPLILAASLYILLNSLVFTNESINNIINLQPLVDIGVKVSNGTMSMLSIFIAFLLAYNLAKLEERPSTLPEIQAGLIGVASMVAVWPSVVSIVPIDAADAVNISGVYSQAFTSSAGLFIAMITSILSYELLYKVFSVDKCKIKLPKEAPPAIAKSFNAIIPAIITISTFAIVAFLTETFSGNTIPQLIEVVIQRPAELLMQSPVGMLVIVFIQNLLWVFGIHGASVLSPITSPTLLNAIGENQAAFDAGKDIPNIVTQPFLDSYNLMIPVALIIAVVIFSKSNETKSVAKLGLVPAIFNISEPIMFGIPVVLNPVYMLPYLIAPTVNLLIAYILTAVGIIGKSYVIVPWTTPLILQPFLSTGGDIKAAILAVLLLALDVLIFMPFIIAANKVKDGR